MKTKQQKPLSMRFAAHTTLHINNDFVTNGHFALRSSLSHVLVLPSDLTEKMKAYEVKGTGRFGFEKPSWLSAEKVEHVFARAYDEEYEDCVPVGVATDDRKGETFSTLSGKKATISKRYSALFHRLASLIDGKWQINTASELKALRFVLNGETVALLMPVKGPQ